MPPFRGVQDTLARDRAFNAAHEQTRATIAAEAKARGWKLIRRHHDPVSRKETHSFDSPTHVTHIVHEGGSRLTSSTAKRGVTHQHSLAVEEIAKTMRGQKLVSRTDDAKLSDGTPVTVHHYESPSHATVIVHSAREFVTFSKPRAA